MKKNFKTICCDNSGENKTLGKLRRNYEEIIFAFTSPGNPQKNGVTEQVFATLSSRMHVIIAYMVMHENIKNVLQPEYTATMNKLGNMMVNMHEEKCANKKFNSKMIDYEN